MDGAKRKGEFRFDENARAQIRHRHSRHSTQRCGERDWQVAEYDVGEHRFEDEHKDGWPQLYAASERV